MRTFAHHECSAPLAAGTYVPALQAPPNTSGRASVGPRHPRPDAGVIAEFVTCNRLRIGAVAPPGFLATFGARTRPTSHSGGAHHHARGEDHWELPPVSNGSAVLLRPPISCDVSRLCHLASAVDCRIATNAFRPPPSGLCAGFPAGRTITAARNAMLDDARYRGPLDACRGCRLPCRLRPFTDPRFVHWGGRRMLLTAGNRPGATSAPRRGDDGGARARATARWRSASGAGHSPRRASRALRSALALLVELGVHPAMLGVDRVHEDSLSTGESFSELRPTDERACRRVYGSAALWIWSSACGDHDHDLRHSEGYERVVDATGRARDGLFRSASRPPGGWRGPPAGVALPAEAALRTRRFRPELLPSRARTTDHAGVSFRRGRAPTADLIAAQSRPPEPIGSIRAAAGPDELEAAARRASVQGPSRIGGGADRERIRLRRALLECIANGMSLDAL